MLIAGVLAGGLVATASAATAGRPALRVLDQNPLVVRATGFGAAEPVIVYATTRNGTVVRRLRAGSKGGFTIRFPQLTYDFCTSVSKLRATGPRSGGVTIRAPRRPCVELGAGT